MIQVAGGQKVKMELPDDMLYEIASHVDKYTLLNMCLAHRDLWQRKKKVLYMNDYDDFIDEAEYHIKHIENGLTKPTKLKRLHVFCRICLKYKHILYEFAGDKFREIMKAKFNLWVQDGMCPRKARKYRKELNI